MVLANTAKMAMLRQPYHHRNEGSEESRVTEYQSSMSQSINISTSVPFLIVRHCVRIAARTGLKSVFSGGNSEDLHMRERPFHSVWYGHANKIPETLLPSPYKSNPVQDTGTEQSFEWLAKAAVANTPLVSCNPQKKKRLQAPKPESGSCHQHST